MRSFLRIAVLTAGVVGSAAFAAPVSASPAADPPAELGESYAIDGVTITPVDLPFDEVGLAVLDSAIAAGSNVTMAHRTLPLPSYAEVTALDSGRTILVRIERRGPLSGSAFVALSTAAFAQIGADPSRPLAVRVRRVAPQEFERSLLRTGQRAPERLATPKPLLEVLHRRLTAKDAPSLLLLRGAVDASLAHAAPTVAAKSPTAAVTSPAAMPSISKSSASYAVQVAAFNYRAGAESTAKKLGGTVSSAGKMWRVRIGPFASRSEAGTAQAKARKAGFADAQIVSFQNVTAK